MGTETPKLLEDLGGVAELARTGDREGVIARLVRVALELASDIPILGPLGETGVRALLDRTSTGRIKNELAAIDAETSRVEQAAQVAAFVARQLGEELHDLHQDQQAIAAALVRLDERLAELQAGWRGQDRIYQKQVDGGATGTILEGGARAGVDLTQDRVTGAGTVGVRVQATPRKG